jgi:hypothetical protein
MQKTTTTTVTSAAVTSLLLLKIYDYFKIFSFFTAKNANTAYCMNLETLVNDLS